MKVGETSKSLHGLEDVLTIKAFRDTWALGIHSYLVNIFPRSDFISSVENYLNELRISICSNRHRATFNILCVLSLDEIFGHENSHFTKLYLLEKK